MNPGPTTPFYILVHVPLDTPARLEPYTATLHVDNGGGEVVDIPVEPARLELRLGRDQHALGLRRQLQVP